MANGNFGGGNGTALAPYLVEDADDLNSVRNYLSSYFLQTKDIDLSSYQNWSPIGSFTDDADANSVNSTGFAGSYNGGSYRISNLKINTSSLYVGLFSYLRRATITNLNIADCNINSSNDSVGAIAGTCYRSVFKYCSVSGSVSGRDNVGGFVGRPYGKETSSSIGTYSTASIEDCYTTAGVTGRTYVGGFTGLTRQEGGGGTVSTLIKNSYAAGPILGVRGVAGLCGPGTNNNTKYGQSYVNNRLVNAFSLMTNIYRASGSSVEFFDTAGSLASDSTSYSLSTLTFSDWV